jgi:hypothetical protein
MKHGHVLGQVFNLKTELPHGNRQNGRILVHFLISTRKRFEFEKREKNGVVKGNLLLIVCLFQFRGHAKSLTLNPSLQETRVREAMFCRSVR